MEWEGFPLLGAHCFTPPGAYPKYCWGHIDSLPEPVRLFEEFPPDPAANCQLRRRGAQVTLATTRAVATLEE
eukprot:3192370-Prorocentrum_lima.AAC.1